MRELLTTLGELLGALLVSYGAALYSSPLGFIVAGVLIANRLMPLSSGNQAASQPSRWDLPVRMGVAAMLVVVLTALADRLGPRLSGILTAFPVATVVIGVWEKDIDKERARRCEL